jgi:anti-anti-sigma factor
MPTSQDPLCPGTPLPSRDGSDEGLPPADECPAGDLARVSATVDGVVLATVLRHCVSTPGSDPSDTMGVVSVDGDVDRDSAPVLLHALMETIAAHPRVCCDLSRATFFAAAGMSTVLAAHWRAAATGGHLTVRGAHGLTLVVLTALGLDQILDLSA